MLSDWVNAYTVYFPLDFPNLWTRTRLYSGDDVRRQLRLRQDGELQGLCCNSGGGGSSLQTGPTGHQQVCVGVFVCSREHTRCLRIAPMPVCALWKVVDAPAIACQHAHRTDVLAFCRERRSWTVSEKPPLSRLVWVCVKWWVFTR